MSQSPVQVLREELGALGLVRVAASLAARSLWDRPFGHLPPAPGERERKSRDQARPAVLLYRTLKRIYPRDRALAVTGKVITAGALAHLERLLGDLNLTRFAALSETERRSQVEGWLSHFYTSTARVDETSDRRVTFTVTACALVRLSMAAGHPELAPLFCEADGAFFEARGVAMERPSTLARGGSSCPFHLSLADSPTPG